MRPFFIFFEKIHRITFGEPEWETLPKQKSQNSYKSENNWLHNVRLSLSKPFQSATFNSNLPTPNFYNNDICGKVSLVFIMLLLLWLTGLPSMSLSGKPYPNKNSEIVTKASFFTLHICGKVSMVFKIVFVQSLTGLPSVSLKRETLPKQKSQNIYKSELFYFTNLW